ncbi:MAG TPA: pseudouridine synthase [Chitinophagaceae bacterium]|jgi:23S rRNA pseudouridine2457 synthase|nr:pseudouridine synthase [Chitinophagaceae bacterium]
MIIPRYFIINKPYDMLSQFVSEKQGILLGDIDFTFPEGIHAVGRLDKQSEGLLILTTNKKVTRLLFQDATPHKRTYLVKAKNNVSEERLQQLRLGIKIRIKGGGHYTTTSCEVSIVKEPAGLFKRINAPAEYPPHTWLLITITEGKFHQVRKMLAAIHHRCQRLIRVSIEDIILGDLQPGDVKEIEEADFFRLLKIK